LKNSLSHQGEGKEFFNNLLDKNCGVQTPVLFLALALLTAIVLLISLHFILRTVRSQCGIAVRSQAMARSLVQATDRFKQ